MIMAGNQPYFYPYLGYWQLINRADVFVIGDDYQYVKQSWINRNRIQKGGKVKYLTLEVAKGAFDEDINLKVLSSGEHTDLLKIIKDYYGYYGKCPYFGEVYPVLEELISCDGTNLADYLEYQIKGMCRYLGIETEFRRTSEFNTRDMDMTSRIFTYLENLGCDTYINAIGGTKLYDVKDFAEHGYELQFLKMDDVAYRQAGNDGFEPGLSIIDVLMNCGRERTREMLRDCTRIV